MKYLHSLGKPLHTRPIRNTGRIFHRFPGSFRRLGAVIAVVVLAGAILPLGAPSALARYASIVVDFETGQVLNESNADTPNYPASLTKMMTLYLAFEALQRGDLSLDQKLTVSRRAAGMPSSKLGLRRGEKIAVKDLLLALVTKSANDAAVVMAEAIAGREIKFAQLMTKKARDLGMTRTSFRNASGLPNRGQLSTARDMATLAAALIRDYPKYYQLFSTAKFTYRGTTHRNHNRLLRQYEGTDGIKTGYIRASGFNLVASAVRDGRRLIAVVFGGKSPRARDNKVARLMDTAFARIATAGIGKAPAPPATKPAFVAPELVIDVAAETADLMPTDGAAPVAAEIGEGDVSDIDVGDDAIANLAWGVQVGAFYRPDAAKRAALAATDQAREVLSEARVMVSTIKGQRGEIFRARLVGLSEIGARDACNQLKSAKVDCLVVQVGQVSPVGGRIVTN